MKILCFIVIGIAFLLFYQSNPMLSLILVIVIIAGYLVVKIRKREKGKGSIKSLMKGINSNREGSSDKILTYLLLDKYLSSSEHNNNGYFSNPNHQYLEQQKQKILKILRE